MRIMHVSDTHGGFPRLNGIFDVIVHSGDILKNSSFDPEKEKAFQESFVKQRLLDLKEWAGNKPFLFTPGNHDFIDPMRLEFILQQGGINAYSLSNKLVNYSNVNFYGFPYVPYFNGNWNYELDPGEMENEVNKVVEINKNTSIDVFVAHCPPYKILDNTFDVGGRHIGNKEMNYALQFKGFSPLAYLCGHVHESFGVTIKNNTIYSNAAITKQIIEI